MTALSSLKILDFSTLLPGPFATMTLADLGAEVLRVEAPGRPDLVRAMEPRDANGDSLVHAALNRSKRALALDLKKPAAVAVIKRLVQTYDIVLEQFRPGVMDRLGVGYAALGAVNPRLIYCSLTGYGQTGPYRNRAGHDNGYMAISGLSSYSGPAGGPPPLPGVPLADVAGGSLHAVIAILAAVVQRQHSGAGQAIDISMTDAMFAMNVFAAPGYLADGGVPAPGSMLLNGGGYYGHYETRDGRYFAVGSLEPSFRRQLCNSIDRPDLIDLAGSSRPEDLRSFATELQAVFRTRDSKEWARIFAAVDACVEPVLTLAEAVHHPQIVARDLITEVPAGEGRTQRQLASPYKFSRSAPRYQHTGRPPGADTAAVLREHGYGDAELRDLAAAGVFGAPATGGEHSVTTGKVRGS